MALRNQPYFPLYVQDYLTDEKLSMCSWSTQGIYIKILCILHKQKEYGKILFKQNDKQDADKCLYFANVLIKLLPCQLDDMVNSIKELLENDVLIIDGDYLIQKRMVKDGSISELRAAAGKKGGGNPNLKDNLFKQNGKQPNKQKDKQKPEDEIEDEIAYKDKLKEGDPVKITTQIDRDFETLIEVFNHVRKTNFKSTGDAAAGIKKNYIFWLQSYTNEEIEQAIRNIPKDKFWKDTITPTVFFRQKNTNKESVDYIGQFLNMAKKNNPFV